MDTKDRESLADYIRSLGLDNFHIADGLLRLGSRSFSVARCGCGAATCDGWTLKPCGGVPRRWSLPRPPLAAR